MVGVAPFANAEAYSIIANPGEDCSTQMNIGWQADLGDTNDVVVYTIKSDTSWTHAATAQGSFKKCEIFDGISSKAPDGADWKEAAKFLDYGVNRRCDEDRSEMHKHSIKTLRFRCAAGINRREGASRTGQISGHVSPRSGREIAAGLNVVKIAA